MVFNWDALQEDPPVREVDLSIRPDLLPLMVKAPGILEQPDRPDDVDLSRSTYLDVLSRRPIVEVTGYQDFQAAAQLAREVLDRYAP